MEWPADHVERRPLASLLAYAKNARKHSPGQVEQIAASMREWGFTIPVLVDEKDELIAGHGRILAAAANGYESVPVMVARGWSEKQIKAYRLADNQLALNAAWDEVLLRAELTELQGLESLMGFSEDELLRLFRPSRGGLTDPDDVPDLPDVATTREGDVWLLGHHRLLCGDATRATDVAKLFAGVTPNLMVTDPPYGVNYDPTWRDGADLGVGKRSKGKVTNDDRADWTEAWALFPGNIVYVWHGGLHSAEVQQSLESAGFAMRAQIIWTKQHFVMSRGDYHWQHEPCQPAGTMVSKVLKEGRWCEQSVIEQVPIEILQAGDKVVSFGNAKIFRHGREITRIGKRSYTGNMHHVTVGGLSTKATAEHQFSIRLDPEKAKSCILYLMRKGDRWRIGVCKLFNSRGFGLAVRLDQEKGDEAWIVSAHPNMRNARVAEQVAACVFGIPTTHWETDRCSGSRNRDKDDIERIYRQIGCCRIAEGAARMMAQYGLNAEFALIRSGEVGRFSRSQSRVVRSCNLVPGIMQLPIPTHGDGFVWQSIGEMQFEPVADTEVWSMDVAEDHHYVADGIVTHNCWYAVRNKGQWAGDRRQTTVWDIANNNAFGGGHEEKFGHGTQKPVECMRRPIVNNSSPGQAVYDPFVGSGTTIIAGEMEGRSVLALELAPLYCDQVVLRWQAFTGETAMLEGGGSFEQTKKKRHRADAAQRKRHGEASIQQPA